MNQSFFGEKLRLARQFHGLTLAELGDRIGVSRQYVQQLEADAKAPNIETENALAAVLDVEGVFFRASIKNTVKVEQTYFRKLQSTPISVVHQVLAFGTMLEQLITYLDARLTLPVVRFPEAYVKNSQEIEDLAAQCRNMWGLSKDKPIQNMTRVLENAGAVVANFSNDSEKLDALSMSRARPIVVRSTGKGSACRLRFDLAHECGHLVMHQGADAVHPEAEKQANRFAAAILLPEKPFREEFPVGMRIDWLKVYSMKLKWKVSVQAIIHRALDLSLIDAGQFKKARLHLQRNGQMKSEKFDDVIPSEKPELLQGCFDLLQEHKRLYVGGIASDLGIGINFLKTLIGFVDVEKYFSEMDNEAIGRSKNVVRFAR